MSTTKIALSCVLLAAGASLVIGGTDGLSFLLRWGIRLADVILLPALCWQYRWWIRRNLFPSTAEDREKLLLGELEYQIATIDRTAAALEKMMLHAASRRHRSNSQRAQNKHRYEKLISALQVPADRLLAIVKQDGESKSRAVNTTGFVVDGETATEPQRRTEEEHQREVELAEHTARNRRQQAAEAEASRKRAEEQAELERLRLQRLADEQQKKAEADADALARERELQQQREREQEEAIRMRELQQRQAEEEERERREKEKQEEALCLQQQAEEQRLRELQQRLAEEAERARQAEVEEALRARQAAIEESERARQIAEEEQRAKQAAEAAERAAKAAQQEEPKIADQAATDESASPPRPSAVQNEAALHAAAHSAGTSRSGDLGGWHDSLDASLAAATPMTATDAGNDPLFVPPAMKSRGGRVGGKGKRGAAPNRSTLMELFATTESPTAPTALAVDIAALDASLSAATPQSTAVDTDLAALTAAVAGLENVSATPAPPQSLSDLLASLDAGTVDTASESTTTVGEERVERTTLLVDVGVASDMNKAGCLRAGKGKSMGLMGAKAHSKPRVQMEDTHAVAWPFGGDANRAVLAVFDGHIDKNAAEAARELVPQVLARLWDSADPFATDLRDVLHATVVEADRQMAAFEDEGCTATVVVVWRVPGGRQRYVQAANVGDSTAYLVRGQRIEPLTKDHRVTDPEERARMAAAGVDISDGQTRINGLSVARALGDHFPKQQQLGITGEPFVSPPVAVPLDEAATVIVASDGLWDTLSPKTAAAVAAPEPSAEAMAKKLLLTALQSSKCHDNVTVVVARL